RGIFLPPANLQWSLKGVPDQIQPKEKGEDAQYWELARFIRLALAANPNILECLWTPKVREATPFVRHALLENRRIFLSKRIYQTYSGYARQQIHRLRERQQAGLPIRWKHAM